MAARFLNTNLVLRSRSDLRPLAARLESLRLFCLSAPERHGGVWRTVFDTNHVLTSPKRATTTLVRAAEKLAGEERAAWDRCLTREFDLGFEPAPGSFNSDEFTVDGKLISRISALGGSLRITIYQADPDSESGET